MGVFVVTDWKASNSPVDGAGNYVHLTGRQGGVISWALALLKVDPTTSVTVSMNRVEIAEASLAGSTHWIIPVTRLCSSYYGYHKPWKAAAGLFLSGLLLSRMMSVVSADFSLILTVLSVVVAWLYYYLNRSLTIGFVEISGEQRYVRFLPSVIENIEINEEQARYICEIVQHLIEGADSRGKKDSSSSEGGRV